MPCNIPPAPRRVLARRRPDIVCLRGPECLGANLRVSARHRSLLASPLDEWEQQEADRQTDVLQQQLAL